jgi:hypothetical protein
MFIHLNTRLYAKLYVCMCVCSYMKGEISLSLTNMILLDKVVKIEILSRIGEGTYVDWIVRSDRGS